MFFFVKRARDKRNGRSKLSVYSAVEHCVRSGFLRVIRRARYICAVLYALARDVLGHFQSKTVCCRFAVAIALVPKPFRTAMSEQRIEVRRDIRVGFLLRFVLDAYRKMRALLNIHKHAQDGKSFLRFRKIIRRFFRKHGKPLDVEVYAARNARHGNGTKHVTALFSDEKRDGGLFATSGIREYIELAFVHYYIARRVRPQREPVARIRIARVAVRLRIREQNIVR